MLDGGLKVETIRELPPPGIARNKLRSNPIPHRRNHFTHNNKEETLTYIDISYNCAYNINTVERNICEVI
jgi:hypothetical protein